MNANGSNGNGEVKPQVLTSPLSGMPAAARNESVRKLIEVVEDAAGPGVLVTLTPTARLHIYKPYQGVEAPAGSLARFAEEDPRLVTAGVDPKEMLDRVELVDRLTKARATLANATRSVEDTLMVLREELFRDTQVIYGLAIANSRLSPALADTVKGFEEFLARGKKPKASGEVTPVPTEEPILEPRPMIPAVTGDR